MIYLILSILGSVLISTVMHVAESRVKGHTWMLCCNYFSSVVLGMILLLSEGQILPLGELRVPLTLGPIAGVLFLGSFLLTQWNTGHNGIVLTSLFMKLGVMIPVLLSILVLGEKPGAAQLAGIALAVLSILLTRENSSQIQAFTPLLLLLGVEGMASFMPKLSSTFSPRLTDHFLTLTFAVSMILSAALSLHRKETLTWREMLWGIALSIPDFFQARLMMRALTTIKASVAYPAHSVSCILLLTLIGVIFFREKLSRRRVAAIAVILVSLALLNL